MNYAWAMETVKTYAVRRMVWSPGWQLTSGTDGKLVYSHPSKGKPVGFAAMQLDKDATDWVHVDPAKAKAAERQKAEAAAQRAAPRKRKAKAK